MSKFGNQVRKTIGFIAMSILLAVPVFGFSASENASHVFHAQNDSNTTEEDRNTAISRDSDIILTGLNAPVAKYGENATVGFVAKVKGEGYITSISPVISDHFPFETNDAAYMVVEGNETARELPVNYNFVVRSDVATGYQGVEFNVEYMKDGMNYSVVKTVNIKFGGAPAPTEATEAPATEAPAVSTPRVIVTGYETNPEKVLAGESFLLTLHLQNTSTRTAVSNMKISLESANGEFLPVSGSSTQFISSLGSGKTADLTIEMSALASLEPKPYVLTLTCNYEDGEANAFESQENVSIPVYQEARIKITDVSVSPDTLRLNDQGSVSFSINNLGKSTLNNVQARLEGKCIECEETFVGNIAAGASGYADIMVTGIKPTTDDGRVKLILTYEDSAGEECTYEDEVSIFVTEEVTGDFFPEEPIEEPEKNPLKGILIAAGILVGIAVIITVIVVIVVKKKKRREAEEAEELEDEINEELLSDRSKEN